MPEIYRQALIKMGHPLVFVNKFIYDNLIKHALEVGKEKFNQEQLEYLLEIQKEYTHPMVWRKELPVRRIDQNPLARCFEIFTPKTLEGKQLAEWKNKIKASLDYYDLYLESVNNTSNEEEIMNALEYDKRPDYCIHL